VTLPTVVCDASVALKWFHEAGEEEVAPSRALLAEYADRRLDLIVLDLSVYEIGNALVRGIRLAPAQAATILDALRDICPGVAPTPDELTLAVRLSDEHGLTFYDASYAAVAQARSASLATLDGALLAAGLGVRPSSILAVQT
jgi:predicted nucleic acid-binding protein